MDSSIVDSSIVDSSPESELADRCRQAVAELTIPILLLRNATEFGDRAALTMMDTNESVTWSRLRDRVAAVSRGLTELGLRPGDRMLILMRSRIEHWVVDLAAVHLGAVPCTAYGTLSTDQLAYLARHSGAPVIVIEGESELDRWRPVLPELGVRHVVVVDDKPLDNTVPLRELEASGARAHAADPGVFERAWPAVRPEQPVTLLYTSGTTGDPKGVVISHLNVLYQTAILEATIPIPDHPQSVAYLPLAHIAERVLGIYNLIYRAGHATVCPDPTQLLAALRQARPGSFFGVPRIWEKLVAGVQAQLGAADPQQRDVFEAASAVAVEVFRLREAGEPVPEALAQRHAELDATVLRPVRAMLGLDEVMWGGTGAAPIPVEILVFLAGLGLDVLEVWGMTETTGTATINTPTRFRTGSVGRVNPGMDLRIAPDGEIMVRGPLVCLGYLQADGSVEPVVDEDGWLATGDVGTMDADGFLTITDRKKELIITSAGKNVSPAGIENLLRAHPLIGQAVAIGDRRAYVTALIVLDDEYAPRWAASHGVTATDLATLATQPELVAEVQAAVDRANEKLSRPEQVKTFRILPRAWTPESGELTPTLKLRRRIILDRYATEVAQLYGD